MRQDEIVSQKFDRHESGLWPPSRSEAYCPRTGPKSPVSPLSAIEASLIDRGVS